MPPSPDELLRGALPGVEIEERRSRFWRLPERPWRYWRASDSNWAVYLVVGRRVSEGALQSIAMAPEKGLKPIILAPSGQELEAAAPHFMNLQSHIACYIAGQGQLIPPPVLSQRAYRRPRPSLTRVPIGLLKELVQEPGLPSPLRRRLSRLHAAYVPLARAKVSNDEKEQVVLSRYAAAVLRSMGFESANIDAPAMIRRLETAGWGGSRDHFFHSFQNYFFGLFAIGKLHKYFQDCREVARLNFAVDPLGVWFFTALWHDVGYGIERFDAVADDILGSESAEDIGEHARVQFLKTDIVGESLRMVSTLMARLLDSGRVRSYWSIPTAKWRRLPIEGQIEHALVDNVMGGSHGAAGALRLYADYMSKVNRMTAAKQSTLRPTVLHSCCSIPFHDYHFRECMRQCCGGCTVPIDTMPFAGLLAFIDSIQDDRRDLAGVRQEVGFLERLFVRAPATIAANVNEKAIKQSSFLWKIVEARDVLGVLRWRPNQLAFEYPHWMVT